MHVISYILYAIIGFLFGGICMFLIYERKLLGAISDAEYERTKRQDKEWQIKVLQAKLSKVSYLYPITTAAKSNSMMN